MTQRASPAQGEGRPDPPGSAEGSHPGGAGPADRPPRLSLTLTPRAEGEVITGLHVDYEVERPRLRAGDVVCRLPIVITVIPGLPLDAADIAAGDDLGELELRQDDGPPEPSWTYRRWTAARPTAGDVHVSYLATPRAVDESTPNGPLLDLRAEAGGLNGGGISFLALPGAESDYDVTISWDLSGAPAGTQGLTSFGEGSLRLTATAEDLAFCIFAAGPLHRYPAVSGRPFAMYWLSEPSFDPAVVAERVGQIYDVLCRFFREPDPGHRVFIRQHPHRGTSGTAFRRSFMLGYSALEQPNVDSLSHFLAHETAHNWPRLDGEHAEIVWYTEGAAEYYSIVLCHRAGLISDEEFLTLINERARAYYTSPLQNLSLTDAATRFWTDTRAQRVPYRRGLFYLIDLNQEITRASKGRRSVDDLVLEEVLRHQKRGRVTVQDWVDMVAGVLGEPGRTGFEAMVDGQWIVPRADALGPAFTCREIEDYQLELGFAAGRWSNLIVTGLVPGSEAERAGVREGDVLLSSPNLADLDLKPRSEVTLRLRRGEERLEVSYAPRGALVRSYEWTLNSAQPR
jgi:predicted metalloprotease with PDZ domain